MSKPPTDPKIYHITLASNLPHIIENGCLWSDAKRIELELDTNLIGMSRIKKRRLEDIKVSCVSGTTVGQFVPFYYCPRSIMLYILHRGNHEDITYSGGQQPIVHLQADLKATLKWAEENGVAWALCPSNAGAYYAEFYNKRKNFDKIDWAAVGNRDFRDRGVKEGKQAEFLLYESFPWSLVEHVGVFDKNIGKEVVKVIKACEHRPSIRVENGWYF